MARVTGLGGTFARSRDPEALYQWYEKHLHLKRENGCFCFPAEAQRRYAVVAFFSRDDDYWPASQPAMLNLQVDDLKALPAELRAAGIDVDPKQQSYDFGHFGWFTDLEGNRVELWEPPKS
jgi:predicted enzyme related to lactoylglutathione lyase